LSAWTGWEQIDVAGLDAALQPMGTGRGAELHLGQIVKAMKVAAGEKVGDIPGEQPWLRAQAGFLWEQAVEYTLAGTGFEDAMELAFKRMMRGDCIATVVPIKNLEKNDREGKKARVVYRHAALPNQALSAGPRITAEMRDRIQQAMLSKEGRQATAALRATYAGRDFVPATAKEYAGLGVYLRDSLYYSY
jgi:hypothetical protein